jgi:hypothetical protein
MPNLPLKSSIALISWQSVMALKRQDRVMNRFCSYLWVFEQAHADKTRSAFDKSQTTDIVAVCVAIL